MSDKRYYTPTLKDFSYGLIYQIQSSSLTPSEDDWSDLIYDEGNDEMSFSTIGGLIREGNIRVQYLSKEDIVSCGWTYKEQMESPMFFDFGERYRMCYYDGNGTVRIRIYDKQTSTNWHKIKGEEEQLFYGECKNISTFKTLMKQLGIEIKKDNQ